MKKTLNKEGLVHEGARLINSSYGNWCEIGGHSTLQNTTFEAYSYCGGYCTFQNAQIGKFSNIAASVRVGATDHPLDRATLHHFTYRSALYGFGEDDHEFFNHRESRIATIGHDTWIGHGAMIKPGIVVGNGAVVGQGAVVTRDVPPYAIVAGNPARILRYRFGDNTIDSLQAIAWWDWSDEKIKTFLMDFRESVEVFIARHLEKEASE
ncbi:MAG: chloramphenicol acetyltransferase [delta proteobacterium ML8_F1]|nr:MAG: chloramphenicol acetyltransferase [delta proteobacterium ML8_F1]